MGYKINISKSQHLAITYMLCMLNNYPNEQQFRKIQAIIYRQTTLEIRIKYLVKFKTELINLCVYTGRLNEPLSATTIETIDKLYDPHIIAMQLPTDKYGFCLN